MRWIFLYFSLFAFYYLLITGCALQRSPSGGPADEVPPYITHVSPAPGSVNVDQQPKIEITFSEKMSSNSIPKSIQATPSFGKISVDRFGNTYTIQPKDTLRSNQTYVVTIGRYQDYHRVRQDSLFTFAFSTGAVLDRGRIAGNIVFPEDSRGFKTLINVFDVDDTTQTPLYIIEGDREGLFELSYMKLGAYQLNIFQDRNNNRRFDWGAEFGADTVVTLTDSIPEKTNLQIAVTLTDTTAPAIKSVKSENQRYLLVEFSEVMADDHLLDLSTYTLIDTNGIVCPLKRILLLSDLYDKRNTRTRLQFLTAPQRDTLYQFMADTVLTDLAGNHLRATEDSLFRGLDTPDLRPPLLLSYQPENHATPHTKNPQIMLTFDEFVDTTSVEDGFSLRETASEAKITGDFLWDNALRVEFIPHDDLEWVVQYTARLDTIVADVSGNQLLRPVEWKFLPIPEK